MTVSVLVLTRDEEGDLPRCLESVRWSDDVIIFDSFSTDRTVEIAEAAGARVFRRRFDDYGSQREAARGRVGYRNEWVLAVDADEAVDPVLALEVREIARSGPTPHVAYRVRRKDHFVGKWVRRSTLYPSWFIRLYRPDRIRYEPRAVHEYPTVAGSVGELKGHLLHYSFSRGLAEWRAKHVRYAKAEALETVKSLREGSVDWRGLLSLDPVRRRRALKELSFRLPARPFLRFAYMYFLRMGFLDGYPGFRYCRLVAWYERMIVDNVRRLRQESRRGAP